MADAATVAARLKVEGFNPFQRQMAQARSDVQALGNSAKNISGPLKAAGAAITGVGVAIGAGLGIAVKAAIDFESSFAGVRKTVDATEEQFAEMSGALRQLATEIPINVNELNRIAEAAGQLGVEREAIISFTDTMAKLGVTTNLTAEEAASALARLANVMGTSQQDFDRLGATIVELGNNLATTEAEIVIMGQRLAAAGNIAGLSEAEVLGFAGALSSVGIQAEAGGTAFSRVMLNMQNAVMEGGGTLQNFAEVAGMSSQQFAQAFEQDAAGAIISFIEGLNRIQTSGGNLVPVLEGLELNEIRVRNALLSAAGAGDLFRESIALGSKAFEDNTALNEEAARRFETTASQIQLAKNQLTELAIVIGQTLLPIVNKIIAGVSAFVAWLGQLNPTLLKVAVIAASVAAGLALISGPILILLGMLPGILAGIGLLTGAFAGLSIAMGPIALVILGIGAAIAAGILIWRNWGDIVKWVQATWNVVSEKVAAIFNSKWAWLLPGGALFKATKMTRDNWDAIWSNVKAVWEAVSGAISSAFTSQWGWLLPGGPLVKMLIWVHENWHKIWEFAAEIFEKVVGFIAKVAAPLTGIIGEIRDEAERLEPELVKVGEAAGVAGDKAASASPDIAGVGVAMGDTAAAAGVLLSPLPDLSTNIEHLGDASETASVKVTQLSDSTGKVTGSLLEYLKALKEAKPSFADLVDSYQDVIDISKESRQTTFELRQEELALGSDILGLSRTLGGLATPILEEWRAKNITAAEAVDQLTDVLKREQRQIERVTESWIGHGDFLGQMRGELRELGGDYDDVLVGISLVSGQTLEQVRSDLIAQRVEYGDLQATIESVADTLGISLVKAWEAVSASTEQAIEKAEAFAKSMRDVEQAAQPKGQRDSELGEQGRVNAAIEILNKDLEHRRNYINRLQGRAISQIGSPEQIQARTDAMARAIATAREDLELYTRRARIAIPALSSQGFEGAAKALSEANLPGLATGGTVMQPGLALVGEKGPEIASLPRGAIVEPLRSTTSSRSQTIQLTYQQNAPVYGFLDFERQVAEAWRKVKQADGFRDS